MQATCPERQESHLLHPVDLFVELGHPVLVFHHPLHLLLLPLRNNKPPLALLVLLKQQAARFKGRHEGTPVEFEEYIGFEWTGSVNCSHKTSIFLSHAAQDLRRRQLDFAARRGEYTEVEDATTSIRSICFGRLLSFTRVSRALGSTLSERAAYLRSRGFRPLSFWLPFPRPSEQ